MTPPLILDYEDIAAMPFEQVAQSVEKHTGKQLELLKATDILPPDADEEHPAFQEFVGDYMILQGPINQEINHLSAQLPQEEGYAKQGSRLIFLRYDDIVQVTKQVIQNPNNNQILFIRDQANGDMLGAAAIFNMDTDCPKLGHMYLSKHLRRQPEDLPIGVGKWLTAIRLHMAKEKGLTQVACTSRRKGGYKPALRVLEKFGFREVTDSEPELLAKIIPPMYRSPRTIALIRENL